MSFNYLAMVSASTASVFLGSLYGVVFRKLAVKLEQASGKAMPKMTHARRIKIYGGALFVDFWIALVLSYLINSLGVTTLAKSLELTVWIFFGFVVPLTIGAVLWEGKPFKFWLFNAVINAVCLFVMIVILTYWR